MCDAHPTCPTTLLLVLHVTKSHVAIPHIYRFLLGVSNSRNPKPTVLHSTDPFFLLSLTFFISMYFPFFQSIPFTLCRHVRPSHALHLEAFRCRRSFCLLHLLAEVDHKLNTERKCVCWWCACTCMAASLFGPVAPSSPLLLMSLKGV